MDNEATKILENGKEKNASVQNNQQPRIVVEKSGSVIGKIAATAAGVVIGSGAAIGGEKVYDHYVENAEKESASETHEEEPEEPVHAQAAAHAAAHTEEPAHVEPHTVHTAETHETITDIEPKVTEVNTPWEESETTDTGDDWEEGDDEVHVVGVAVQDNGMGGMSMIAGLQAGEDQAIVVDIDSNGTIDLVGIDENMNGHLEEDEWHIVEDGELDTADVLEAYMEEAEANGEQALVANLDTGETMQLVEDESSYYVTSLEESDDSVYPDDDNLYYTSDDDNLPDYMSDADAGMFES